MGQQLLAWYGQKNVARVVRKAERKAKTAVPGAVPPRVAADVFEKSQWADDEFVSEYLSGVLASSRTAEGTNDRGVSWTALVGRLSADQLRLHYALYGGFRDLIVGRDGNELWTWTQTHLLVDFLPLFRVLDWNLLEGERATNRLWEALYGLEREGLVEQISHGDADYLSDEVAYTKGRLLEPDGIYVTFCVTTHGISLFLNAQGHGDGWVRSISDEKLDMSGELEDGTNLSRAAVKFVTDYPMKASR